MAKPVDVFCLFEEMLPTDKVIGNPRNPNTHPPSQIALLAKIISTQGWRNPIVISRRSGFVIKGHGRLAAAKLLQLESVPVEYQDYADEATEWADMIADNRIAELAETDMTMLKDLLQEMDTGAIDMDLTGFDSETLKKMLGEAEGNIVPKSQWLVLIEVGSESEQADVLNECMGRGWNCKALSS